jgi:hypothetical protein
MMMLRLFVHVVATSRMPHADAPADDSADWRALLREVASAPANRRCAGCARVRSRCCACMCAFDAAVLVLPPMCA